MSIISFGASRAYLNDPYVQGHQVVKLLDTNHDNKQDGISITTLKNNVTPDEVDVDHIRSADIQSTITAMADSKGKWGEGSTVKVTKDGESRTFTLTKSGEFVSGAAPLKDLSHGNLFETVQSKNEKILSMSGQSVDGNNSEQVKPYAFINLFDSAYAGTTNDLPEKPSGQSAMITVKNGQLHIQTENDNIPQTGSGDYNSESFDYSTTDVHNADDADKIDVKANTPTVKQFEVYYGAESGGGASQVGESDERKIYIRSPNDTFGEHIGDAWNELIDGEHKKSADSLGESVKSGWHWATPW